MAIAAARAGAAEEAAADIDPFAEAALTMNARANGVHLAFARRDLLPEPPPDVDVLLAGDTWYEGPLAERVLPWLRAAAARGIRVLVGDPGPPVPARSRDVRPRRAGPLPGPHDDRAGGPRRG